MLRLCFQPLWRLRELQFLATIVVGVRVLIKDDFPTKSAVVRNESALSAVTNATQTNVQWGFEMAKDVPKQLIQEFEDWDREHGWSAGVRRGIDVSDVDHWPAMPRVGNVSLGLQNPLIWVLSMPARLPRRKIFKRRFEELCLDARARWAPAVDGTTVPEHLRFLRGEQHSHEFDHDKPGMWACYISHLAILRESYSRCPDCDLVVFEDDVLFAPKFVERWRRFIDAVPKDWGILRMGASAFWDSLFERVNDLVLKPRSVANTWGYVVRASSVKILGDRLAALPVRGAWGVDGVLGLFNEDAALTTYAPAENLLQGVGGCHDTAEARLRVGQCETEEDLLTNAFSTLVKWPQGYSRTYCSEAGKPHPDNEDKIGCKGVDPHSLTCCPYTEAPLKSEIPDNSPTSFGHNYCPAKLGGG